MRNKIMEGEVVREGKVPYRYGSFLRTEKVGGGMVLEGNVPYQQGGVV